MFVEEYKNYNYTTQIDNRHPEMDRQLSKPLILLSGFHNEFQDKYGIVSAYLKSHSFCYVLKYNILKTLERENLISLDELHEANLRQIILFPVNVLSYPKLIYNRHNGEIINYYKLDWCPGYFSFIFNDIILLNILKTISNNSNQIANICLNELEKLLIKIKN